MNEAKAKELLERMSALLEDADIPMDWGLPVVCEVAALYITTAPCWRHAELAAGFGEAVRARVEQMSEGFRGKVI